MNVTTEITIDMLRRGILPVVQAVCGDKNTRSLALSMYANGKEFEPPEGTVAVVRYVKPDQRGGEYDTLPDGSPAYSIAGNVVTVELVPQVLTTPGMVKLNVGLISGEAEVSTFRIQVNVEPNVAAQLLDSADYYNVSWVKEVITQLQQDVSDLKQNGTGGSSDSTQNGNGWTTEQIDLLDSLFNYIPWTSSGAGAIADSLIASLRSGSSGGSGDETPDETDKTLTSISAVYSGGDVTVGTAVTDLTGIAVTAHYSDGSSETVTGYTMSGTIAEGSNAVTVSYGGKTTTFTVTGVAEESGDDTTVEIPADATRLAYIESTGTQCIDTGVAVHWDNEFDMTADITEAIGNTYLFGAYDGTYEAYINPYRNATVTKLCWPGKETNGENANFIGANIKIVGKHKTQNTKLYDSYFEFVSNGVTARLYIGEAEKVGMSANLYLFARNNNGAAANHSSYKLREFVLYTDATRETKIIHLIPVRDPDGVACLYDAVGKKYLYNAGTGDFVGGES